MELVNIRELYRNQEEYLDKTVTIGGWVRSIRSSKNLGLLFKMTELFLSHYRLYMQMA